MCTAFMFTGASSQGPGNAAVAFTGRSLDYDQPTTYTTQQYAPGNNYKSVLDNGVTWTGSYGVFVFDSEEEYLVPFEGLNSAGIGISGNLANAQYPTDKSGPTISSDDLVLYVLSQAGSLLDAAKLLSDINISSPWQYHYLLTDSNGYSLVVEFLGGQAVFSDNNPRVMTNNPDYQSQLANLNNYAHLQNWFPGSVLPDSGDQFHGQGMLGMPGDWMSPSRFVRASYMLQFLAAGTAENCTTDYAGYITQMILNSVSLTSGIDLGSSDTGLPIYTQIQIVKDQKNAVVYYRTLPNISWQSTSINWNTAIARTVIS